MPGTVWSSCWKRCNKFPAVATQDCVGDLAQRVENKVASVAAERACDAALLVSEGFEKQGHKVSPKDHGGCVEQQGVGRDDGEAEGWRTAVRKEDRCETSALTVQEGAREGGPPPRSKELQTWRGAREG